MTNEGLKRCFSETILKASRGMYAMSCVNSEAVLDDKDYDPPRKQSEIVTKQEQCHLECRQEDQEKELLGSFQPQRIRRSSLFTGFGRYEVQAKSCRSSTTFSRPKYILPESRRNRCHSFAGVKNKKLVEITWSSYETAVIDGLMMTTTFCSTDL